jgi:molybdopterin-guanine dinucleotide biosynthesis protein A
MREFVAQLAAKLDELVCRTPVWGCVLIGGRSSRMGRPKHLIKDDRGRTWLENTIGLLRPFVDGIVVSGGGVLPGPVAETIRLADIPGVCGPLTGIVAACRWQPRVSWLVVACDMPHVSAEAIGWLLAERHAGCWGRVPRLAGSDHCEPLFAWYDFRSSQLFEEQLFTGNLRIGDVASHPRIATPVIPEPLRDAFRNVNTPAQLPAAHQ